MMTPGKHDSLATLVELDCVDVAAVVEQRCHRVQSGPYHLYHLADIVVSRVRSSLRNQYLSDIPLFIFTEATVLVSPQSSMQLHALVS